MNFRSDDAKGWVGSIILHAVLALILFFSQVRVSIGEPEFIEVSWGSSTAVANMTSVRPTLAGTEGAVVIPKLSPQSTRQVDVPERKFNGADEVIRLPDGKKLDVDEKPMRVRVHVADRARGSKEHGVGSGLGQKEKFVTPGMGESAGEIVAPGSSGASGSDVGKGVSVSMVWNDGGTRKKISGDLPTYPKGVNVAAQIKITTVVSPSGDVKSLKPAQKGNTRLEDAASDAVRLWRFEPLRKSSPQVEQTCLITFNFELR